MVGFETDTVLRHYSAIKLHKLHLKNNPQMCYVMDDNCIKLFLSVIYSAAKFYAILNVILNLKHHITNNISV